MSTQQERHIKLQQLYFENAMNEAEAVKERASAVITQLDMIAKGYRWASKDYLQTQMISLQNAVEALDDSVGKIAQETQA